MADSPHQRTNVSATENIPASDGACHAENIAASTDPSGLVTARSLAELHIGRALRFRFAQITVESGRDLQDRLRSGDLLISNDGTIRLAYRLAGATDCSHGRFCFVILPSDGHLYLVNQALDERLAESISTLLAARSERFEPTFGFTSAQMQNARTLLGAGPLGKKVQAALAAAPFDSESIAIFASLSPSDYQITEILPAGAPTPRGYFLALQLQLLRDPSKVYLRISEMEVGSDAAARDLFVTARMINLFQGARDFLRRERALGAAQPQ